MATTKPLATSQDETISLPVIEPGAKSFTWVLGEDEVTVSRLKTGAAFDAAKKLVTYLDKLAAAWPTDADASEGRVAIAVIQGIADAFEPDDLISLTAQLTGVAKDVIAEAPLEDTIAMLSGALDLNSMMRLLATLRVLGKKVGFGK